MARKDFNIGFFQFMGHTQKIAYEITQGYEPEGISKIEYTMLEHLYYYDNQSIKSIEDHILMSSSRLRQYLKLLMDKKLVERYRDPENKRRMLYNISRKGKRKLDGCYFEILQSVQDRFKDVSDDQLENVLECMTYITKNLYGQ